VTAGTALAVDAPRLLHRRSVLGYTHNPALAMLYEPETVGLETQRELTARAARTAQQTRADEWAQSRALIASQIDWLYA
jgi:hypothetical protein